MNIWSAWIFARAFCNEYFPCTHGAVYKILLCDRCCIGQTKGCVHQGLNTFRVYAIHAWHHLTGTKGFLLYMYGMRVCSNYTFSGFISRKNSTLKGLTSMLIRCSNVLTSIYKFVVVIVVAHFIFVTSARIKQLLLMHAGNWAPIPVLQCVNRKKFCEAGFKAK